MSKKKTLLSESQIRSFMKLAQLAPLTPGFVQGIKENAEDLEEGRGMRMRGEDEIEEMRHARDEDEIEESHGNGKVELGEPDDGLGRRRDRAGQLEEDAHEEEELDATEDELGAEDATADEEADELAADDAALAGPAPAARMVSIDDFLSALETALETAVGEEVEIDSDEADLEADEADVEADEDALDDAEDALDDVDGLLEDTVTEAAHDEEELEEGTHKDDDLKDNEPGGRGHKKGDKADINESDNAELVEAITKKVAKKIIMEALSSK
jgi:hypothetical protein